LDQLTQPRDEETHQRRNKIIWGFSHHLKIRIPVQFRSCPRGLASLGSETNFLLVSQAATTHGRAKLPPGVQRVDDLFQETRRTEFPIATLTKSELNLT
jgi:hypothetical protein